ncbi:F-box protein At3g07870-like [Papaver somniferum]|uniref:F-box protein At3g07870-like n=1 Tax=Papaver somniferum TaxID=3469 RepID=UPI000E7050BA|nr:F-box protein At3g07870-like [Papaver somniferum]
MSVESLPSDIILDIFSRVPTEFVSECKLVYKKRLTLIQESGTHFTNLHFSLQLKHLYGGDGDNDNNIAVKVEESLYFACCIEDVCAAPLLFYGGHIGARVSFDEQYFYRKKLKRINNPPLLINHLLLNFVGSCNGLMCINIQYHLTIDPIYIFNPVTREYVYLPKLVVKKDDVDPTDPDRIEGVVGMIDCISYGFGYVSSTNEYKVVRINYPNFFWRRLRRSIHT